MATSGTFTGSRGGSSTGPWLSLEWTRIDEDVSNNRSLLQLVLRLHSDRSLYFSASKSGVLEGTSFTYPWGFSGTGSTTVKTINKWFYHDSDGSKSVYLNASFDIEVNWSGNWVSTISVGGTAYLDTIPRTSDFTISGNTLGSPITVSISRASSSFTHSVIYDLPDGSRRDEFTGVTTGTTFTPPLSHAQYMPNSTSITAKILVRTYNNGDFIGEKGKTFTMYIPSSVVPSASGLDISISGTGRDNDIAKFVQGITRVYAEFNTSGIYGSTIVSSKMIVRKDSDNSNSMTISGTSGNSGTLLGSGTYEIITEAVDSRGRSAPQQRLTFTVEAYSAPRITTFSANRNASTSTNVNASVVATWSPLGTSNPTDVSITSVNNSGATSTLYTLNNSLAGTLSTSPTFTGQSDASSYEYTITVTDSFGKTARATTTIGTTFVEFTIAKGEGVGVGKVHERGSLDVAGNAYFEDDAYFEGDISLVGKIDAQFNPIYLGDGVNLNNLTTPGMYYSPSNASVATWLNAPGSKLSCSILVEKHAGIKQTYTEYNSGYANTFTRNYYSGSWGPWRTFLIDGPGYIDGINNYKLKNGYNLATMRESGSPHNDPLLIQNVTAIINTNNSDQAYYDFSFPTAFNGDPLWIIAQPFNGSSSAYNAGVYNITNTGCRVYISHIADYVGTFYIDVNIIAAGKKI